MDWGNIYHGLNAWQPNKYIHNAKHNNWPLFDKRLWQRNYHDHIIRTETSLNNIRKYIIDNPAKWDDDENNIKNYKLAGQACLTPTGQFWL